MSFLYEVPLPPTAIPTILKVLAPFAAIITGIVLHGMHGAFPSWVKSLLSTLTHAQPGEAIWQRTAFAVPRALASGLRWIYHRFDHHVSHAVALKSGPVSDWMEGLNALYATQTTTIARGAEETAQAMEGIRHRVIPREIHKAVNPVAHAAHRAGALAGRSISLEIKDRRDIGRGIDRLKRRGRWPLAAGLLGIDVLLRDHVRPEQKAQGKDLHDLRHRTIPRVNRRLGRLERTRVSNRSRVWKKVAALATVAGLTAAVTRVLIKKWPWLGCRNFGRMSKLLRCSHFGFLADLLAMGLALLSVIDPVAIGKAAILAEDEIHSFVERIADLNPEG